MGRLILESSGSIIPVYSGSAAAWTPASLGANLRAWYKADAGVYSDAGTTPAVNNDLVHQWNDQSGNGFHLTRVFDSFFPTYQTAGLNGHASVLFGVSNAQTNLITASDTVTGLNVNAHSGFAVVNPRVNRSGFARVVGYWGNAQNHDYDNTSSCSWLLLPSTTEVSAYANSSQQSSVTIAGGTPIAVGSIFDGVNIITYLNNSAGSSSAYNQTMSNNGTICVGDDVNNVSGTSGGSWWADYISEVVVANIALDSTTRTNLQSYFQTKWGV